MLRDSGLWSTLASQSGDADLLRAGFAAVCDVLEDCAYRIATPYSGTVMLVMVVSDVVQKQHAATARGTAIA